MQIPKGIGLAVALGLLLPTLLMAQTSKSPDPNQPNAQADPNAVKLTPREIVLYEFAPTLVEWTPEQVQSFPALHKIQPAENQDQLPVILDRAGKTVAIAFQDFPRMACDEAVKSTAGTPPKTKLQDFRYIVLPRPDSDVHVFDEYRTDMAGNPPVKLSIGSLFMITSGFASTWLYLSPDEQHDSRFRYFGTQTIRNRQCHVVGFAQDPQRAHNLGVFSIDGKNANILLQGLAWIDSQTFQILRIMTWLLAPRPDVDLGSEISMVDFFAVQPSGSDRVLWLPRDVKVWTSYRGMAIRNTHHYSNFKLFRVESVIKP